VIEQYGWSDLLAQAFAPHAAAGLSPGRIVVQHRDGYLIATEDGELRGKPAGRLLNEAEEAGYPAVGDWVALARIPEDRAAIIHAVLPRRTSFIRRAADSTHRPQVIAANIDVAFIITSLNADFNLRRVERYLATGWQSGARTMVVLTKADLSADPQVQVAEIAAIAPDCKVLVVAAKDSVGLEALRNEVRPGETCVLIGSSGAGKSTLVNALLGEDRMATHAIREGDGQGRHTTSHRELVLLPHGGLILDTPGIREVGLIDAEEGVRATFDDVEQLIQACRFSNCEHASEPGCAVQRALESGELEAARWAQFQKLAAELAAAEEKASRIASSAERRRNGGQQKAYRTARRNIRGGA
jgi:ribosome biogenesis GTPase / thiamine phosphate phosphatase